MGYGLGVDLGTTHTAAAVDHGRVEAFALGSRRAEIPSMLYLHPDGTMLVGEAAERRGEQDPARLARECKRRIGDPVPIMLGGTPFSAHALTARLLHHVVEVVTRAQGAEPDRIVITHPANWGPYKRELLAQAARLADLPSVTLRPEPEAAAVRFASTARVAEGANIAVYDLGGGTFDAAVLRKTAQGFEVLGEPSGIEQLGGIDFDEAVVEHVRATLGDDALAALSPDDPEARTAMARLRRDCVEAKEALSFDTEAVIAVALPQLHTRVRMSRAEFESAIRPALADTVAALERALRSARLRAEDLQCIVLAGGSSRIPLVTEMLSAAFERPVVLDEQPELGIAMGAALLSGGGGRDAVAPSPGRLAPASGAFAPDSGAFAPVSLPDSPTSAPPASVSAPLSAAASTSAAPASSPAAPVSSPVVPASSPAALASSPAAPGSSAARVPTARARASVKPSSVAPRPAVSRPPPSSPASKTRGRLWSYRWPVIGGVIAAALIVTAATAWPRSGDETLTSAAPSTGPPPPAVVSLAWKSPTAQPATGPVAVAAEHVVVSGADGDLRGLRRSDGRQAWTFEAGKGVTLATSAPGGVVYAITAAGTLLAIDAATGQEQWRKRTGGQFAVRPFVAGPRVYAGGSDSILYAYELGDGHRRWRVWADDEIQQPPVVVGDMAVVASTDGRLYGADQFGGLAWKRTVGQTSHPLAAAGDAVCATVDDGALTCLRATDGRRPIRITLPDTALAVPTGGNGVIYAAAGDRTVGAWDPATGKMRWRYRPTVAGAAAIDLVVHGGQVHVAYGDGLLVGLDAATGRESWQYAVKDTIIAAPTGDGRDLFVVGKTGTVYALTAPFTAGPTPTARPSTPATTAAPETAEPAVTETERRRRTREPERTRPTTVSASPRPKSPTPKPSPTTAVPTSPVGPSG